MKQKILLVGPCAAESEQQVVDTAAAILPIAAAHPQFTTYYRAGAWKPRTSPTSFQGFGEQAIPWLIKAQTATGLNVVTEVAEPKHLLAAYNAGIRNFWIGARTTANPFLVQSLADTMKELASTSYIQIGLGDIEKGMFFIKNPISPDIDLWEGAIRRLRDAGINNIVAVHRGFSLGERNATAYRNAPCWSVPIELRQHCPDLPILCDPSHIAGRRDLVEEVAREAMLLDMDGLMIEVHPHPEEALSDAAQQLTPEALIRLLDALPKVTSSEPDQELTGLRRQIDEIDDEIWALICRRMEICSEIGRYKAARHLPVLQQNRFESLLKRRRIWARKNGLSTEIVDRIMQAIHEESLGKQL